MNTFDLVINNFTNGKCTIKFINLAIKCLLVQTHSKRSVILANCSVVYSSKPPQKLILQFDYKYFKPELFIKQSSAFKYFRNSRFFLSFHFSFPTIFNFLKKENKDLRSHPCHYLRKRASNAVRLFLSFWAHSLSKQNTCHSKEIRMTEIPLRTDFTSVDWL